MDVEAVERGVKAPVREPAIVGGLFAVERYRERGVPGELPGGKSGPEPDVILACAPLQALEVRRLDARPRAERGRRGKGALLEEHGFDVVVRHDSLRLRTRSIAEKVSAQLT